MPMPATPVPPALVKIEYSSDMVRRAAEEWGRYHTTPAVARALCVGIGEACSLLAQAEADERKWKTGE